MAQIENGRDGTTGGARDEVAHVFDQARSERRGECFIEETVYDGDPCPRPPESPAGRDPSEEVRVEKKNAIAFSLPANTMKTVDPRAAHSQVCRDAGPRSPTGNVVGSKWVTTVRPPGL